MSRSSMNRRQSFQPSCPRCGQWYACDAGSRFVGCCNNDPCTLGCKQGNLKPTSFDPAFYALFPDLHCDSASAKFYTCPNASPPFLGCCESDPCNRGCPTVDLVAVHLPGNEGIACQFYARGCPPASSTETASTPTSSPPSSSPPSSSSMTVPQAAASRKSSTGPIVGGVVGGVVGFAMIMILLFYCHRYLAKSRKLRNCKVDARDSHQNMGGVPATKAVSEASPHYEACKPNTTQNSFPFSANDYPSPHTRSHSHEVRASSPSPSELPSYGSPHLSQASPTQPSTRPMSYELSVTPEPHTPASYTPALGLGLNVHPDRSQSYAPAASSPIRIATTHTTAPQPLGSPTAPDLSELSAENGRHGSR